MSNWISNIAALKHTNNLMDGFNGSTIFYFMSRFSFVIKNLDNCADSPEYQHFLVGNIFSLKCRHGFVTAFECGLVYYIFFL